MGSVRDCILTAQARPRGAAPAINFRTLPGYFRTLPGSLHGQRAGLHPHRPGAAPGRCACKLQNPARVLQHPARVPAWAACGTASSPPRRGPGALHLQTTSEPCQGTSEPCQGPCMGSVRDCILTAQARPRGAAPAINFRTLPGYFRTLPGSLHGQRAGLHPHRPGAAPGALHLQPSEPCQGTTEPCQGPCMQASVLPASPSPSQTEHLREAATLDSGGKPVMYRGRSRMPGHSSALWCSPHAHAHAGHPRALARVLWAPPCGKPCASTAGLPGSRIGSRKVLRRCLLFPGQDMRAEQRASQQPHPAEAGRPPAAQIL